MHSRLERGAFSEASPAEGDYFLCPGLRQRLSCCLRRARRMRSPRTQLENFLTPATLTEVFPGSNRVGPKEGEPPAAAVYKDDQLLGYVYLNTDVVSSTGYSGKPIRILIGIDLGARITGAKLVEHHEPIVLIGIPAAKLTALIQSFVGQKIGESSILANGGIPVDIISGATVTTMVIGDSITRSAIRVAEFAPARHGRGGACASGA